MDQAGVGDADGAPLSPELGGTWTSESLEPSIAVGISVLEASDPLGVEMKQVLPDQVLEM